MALENHSGIDLIIIGASGDLARRKIYPALFNLEKSGQLPEGMRIIGASRRDWDKVEYSEYVAEALKEFLGEFDPEAESTSWGNFAQRLEFSRLDVSSTADFDRLADMVGSRRTAIYYAIEAGLFELATTNLSRSRLGSKPATELELVIEKPFGTDLASAENLTALFSSHFSEEQIYRIDHILNRSALIDIVLFRQYNYLLEHMLNNSVVEQVQITYAEDIGIGSRGEFYEHTGALRDMVQSHLLEALTLLLAEIPATADNTKPDFQRLPQSRAAAISSLKFAGAAHLVLGQYAKGTQTDAEVKAYREEQDVAPDSNVETFVALKLSSDLPKWQGVPIYLRTGKRLESKYIDINVIFKRHPHQEVANMLTFRISPNSGVNIRAYKPKSLADMQIEKIDFSHCYNAKALMDPYDYLLSRIIAQDHQLFVSTPEILASWKLIDAIRSAYSQVKVHDYQPGSMGPIAADELLQQDGHDWVNDDLLNFCRI